MLRGSIVDRFGNRRPIRRVNAVCYHGLDFTRTVGVKSLSSSGERLKQNVIAHL
jgi:hypothetical protein